MALMSGDDVDLVTLDLTVERNRRPPLTNAFAELRGHPQSVIGIEVQLLGDLLVRQVQSHEVQAENPDPQRLVVACEDGFGQIVEATTAGRAFVTLAVRLGVVVALSDDVSRFTVRAADAIGPAQIPDHLVALRVVDQRSNVQSHGTGPGEDYRN